MLLNSIYDDLLVALASLFIIGLHAEIVLILPECSPWELCEIDACLSLPLPMNPASLLLSWLCWSLHFSRSLC
jgi:hypothetical protein